LIIVKAVGGVCNTIFLYKKYMRISYKGA